MNSLMQQLFMIPQFRKAILEVRDDNYGKIPDEENILYHSKLLFGALIDSQK